MQATQCSQGGKKRARPSVLPGSLFRGGETEGCRTVETELHGLSPLREGPGQSQMSPNPNPLRVSLHIGCDTLCYVVLEVLFLGVVLIYIFISFTFCKDKQFFPNRQILKASNFTFCLFCNKNCIFCYSIHAFPTSIHAFST